MGILLDIVFFVFLCIAFFMAIAGGAYLMSIIIDSIISYKNKQMEKHLNEKHSDIQNLIQQYYKLRNEKYDFMSGKMNELDQELTHLRNKLSVSSYNEYMSASARIDELTLELKPLYEILNTKTSSLQNVHDEILERIKKLDQKEQKYYHRKGW